MPTPLKVILYPIFAVFCCALFFIILFPFDSVRQRVAREMEDRLGGGYSISIGSLSPSPFNGMVLKNVEIRPRGISDAVPVKLPKAKLNFALLSLLSGNTEVNFDLRTGRGRAEGSFLMKKTAMGLSLKMNGFDLAVIGFLAQQAGIPVAGVMSGTVDLEIYPQDPLRNVGKAVIEIPELQLGEVDLGGGAMKLPSLRLAQLGSPASKIQIEIDKGNFEIKQIQFAGGDIDLQANGKIYGARKMENYRFNLQGSFKVSSAVADKIPLLMMVAKQRSPDGTFPFTITGRFTKPNIRVGEFKVPI